MDFRDMIALRAAVVMSGPRNRANRRLVFKCSIRESVVLFVKSSETRVTRGRWRPSEARLRTRGECTIIR